MVPHVHAHEGRNMFMLVIFLIAIAVLFGKKAAAWIAIAAAVIYALIHL